MRTIVTYLEMKQKPDWFAPTPPIPDITVVQAARPTVSFYRYLYGAVGQQWHWVDRGRMSDEKLGVILRDPAVDVFVLYVAGVPAGYAELDRRKFPDIELAYFGIMPEFIGKKLGPYLLQVAIGKAWQHNPARFWLHTCTLDHPKALRTYLAAGFEIYDKKEETVGEN